MKMGSLSVSPMGFGTWAWGNLLLWGYNKSMDDDELYHGCGQWYAISGSMTCGVDKASEAYQ